MEGDEPEAKRRRVEIPSIEELSSSELSHRFVPILSDEELRNCVLAKAFALAVVEPKLINPIFKYLGDKFPVKSLAHLKRFVEAVSSEDLLEIKQRFPASEVVEVDIPKYEPLTESQRKEWSNHWPIASKVVEVTTPPIETILTEADIRMFVKFLKIAVNEANSAQSLGNRRIGGVMVNEKNEVVATDHDRTSSHLLHHSAMNCIQHCSEDYLAKYGKDAPEDGPYLCTNYRYFTNKEPCTMCSMALLHSRIGMVVYLDSNASDGGLGSKFKVHCTKNLNHSFFVYKANFSVAELQ